MDRIGATLEFAPQLWDTTTGRPIGARGLVFWFMTGAEVVNAGAFSLLDLPTSGV